MASEPQTPADALSEGETLTVIEEVDGHRCPVEVVVLDEARHATRVVELGDGGEIVIGRSEAATVRVDEAPVSRRHATIRRRGARILLHDLGSRNGTMLRGRPVRGVEVDVAPGDWIRIGAVDLFVAARLPGRDFDAAGPRPDVRGYDEVVVADPVMQRNFLLARRLGRTDTTVLLLGETGTGKEVLAEQIHRYSARAGKPLVRLNCASLPDSLIESELFGHERGAFTGAAQRRVGYVEAANGGTLFLDEVGEIPLRVQAKLLRVLEAKSLARLGSTGEIPIDVRFVCATHRDLKAEVQAGRFRQDFYFRVGAFTVRVPPLRERRAEIPLLAALFARRMVGREGGRSEEITPEAIEALLAHGWPGNVRELRNAIEHAIVLADGGPIERSCLPDEVLAGDDHAAAGSDLHAQVAGVERERIVAALDSSRGNQTQAARQLGITRSALLHRMRKYGLGGAS